MNAKLIRAGILQQAVNMLQKVAEVKNRKFAVFAVALMALTLVGCAGGGSGDGGTQPPPLSVSCFPPSVEVGKNSQCLVSPSNTAGSWSIAMGPGSIDSSGLYTAPLTLQGGDFCRHSFYSNRRQNGDLHHRNF
jgi:hypothetical protein